MSDAFEAIAGILASSRRGALATVIRTRGSVPQVPGAKMAMRADGVLYGTVGGGRIEEVVVEAMRKVLESGKPELVRKHLGHDLGMCCGGEMEIFVEPVEAKPSLVLFGAGHVAKPTAAIARQVGFDVTVIDSREEWNNAERFPECTLVLLDPAEAARGDRVEFKSTTFIVITTHDHRLDEEALRACLQKPRAYLGMIGSQRKVIQVFERIRHRANTPEMLLAEVRAPIGLDLGALTPEEIALSIVSEMVQVRRGGKGGPMSLERASKPRDES